MLGKSLEEYAKTDGGEEAWIEALPGMKTLGELIKNEGGPYIMGKTRKSWRAYIKCSADVYCSFLCGLCCGGNAALF